MTAPQPDPPECEREKWCDMPGGHSGECRSAFDDLAASSSSDLTGLRAEVQRHTPWARAEFARYRLWLACYCGWNKDNTDEGGWNEHFLSRFSGTDDGLDELRALSDAATPGPWELTERAVQRADDVFIVAAVNWVREQLEAHGE
jgi:hypothetical protein